MSMTQVPNNETDSSQNKTQFCSFCKSAAAITFLTHAHCTTHHFFR